MTPALLCAFGLSWLIGTLGVMALWPRDRRWRTDAPVILSLGALVGLGVTSVLFTAATLVTEHPARLSALLEIALAAGLAFVVGRTRLARPNATTAIPATPPWTWLEVLLAVCLFQAVVVAAILSWRAFAAEPYGGGDAWAIWNLHARLMLRAGPAWPVLQAAPELSWTHPDYPRLVPGSVARVWAWAGTESPSAAGGISVVFAGAMLVLLVGTIARIRGRTPALLAGLLLTGTPFFVTFASNQHADIPLASFMLAAVALVTLAGSAPASPGLSALAGMAAGLAAWTKNEGLLFAGAFGFVALVRALRAPAPGAGRALLLGLGAALVPVLLFKLLVAPPNDLLAVPLVPRLAQVFDPARHAQILAAFARDLGRFGEWGLAPYGAMLLPLVAWPRRRRLGRGEGIAPLLAGLMILGYYAVYLLTPHALAWHLDSSLVRLLLQVWPLGLLAWSLALPAGTTPPMSAPHRAGGGNAARAWFLAINVFLAAALFEILSRQLADNALAQKHRWLDAAHVTLGEGWFGLERQGADRWAWSRGNAKLLVHVSARDPGLSASLRFELRSLAPRRVAIQAAGAVLWEGAVPAGAVRVELPAQTFPSGTTEIAFSTDAPGVNEAPGSGGRMLVFALYQVRLR